MSTNLVRDIAEMHEKFGVHPAVRTMDKAKLRAFLQFRLDFLTEELNETRKAASLEDWDGVVDGIIDLMVVSIGTLDAFQVNTAQAWDEVHAANMTKQVGVKASRKNDLGLPDLIKPEGFVSPTHQDNLGLLPMLS